MPQSPQVMANLLLLFTHRRDDITGLNCVAFYTKGICSGSLAIGQFKDATKIHHDMMELLTNDMGDVYYNNEEVIHSCI